MSLRTALQEAVDETPEGEMMGDILAAVNQYD